MKTADDFSVAQLKEILGARGLKTSGLKKAELIGRLTEADPSGAWMEHGEVFIATETSDVSAATSEVNNDASMRKEIELLQREKNLMERELALAQRELEMLRVNQRKVNQQTPADNQQEFVPINAAFCPTSLSRLSIKEITELLGCFEGDGNAWKIG